MRTAIISGASSGIGLATAEWLLKNGYNVAGISRRCERLRDLENQYSDQFLNIQADVTYRQGMSEAVSKTMDRFQSVDILINNAGVGYLGKLETGKLEEWHYMFEVNVNGLLSLTHACLPHLLESRGHIINVDSIAGHEVFPEGVVYCATKHAVKAISIGLEKELKGRVKITNISPGPVETEFANHTTDPEKSAQIKEYFVDVLKAEDIANAIGFAVSQPKHVAINEVMVRPFKG